MKAKLLGFIVCAALLGMSQAEATVFNVSFSFSENNVTVNGTITTDGNTGISLGPTDITAWSLAVNYSSPAIPVTLTAANSTLTLMGGDLTATSSALSFNFAGTDGGVLEFASSGGVGEFDALPNGNVIYEAGGSSCDGFGGPQDFCAQEWAAPENGTVATTEETGTVVIGTAAVSTTPLPAALPLFASGLGALAMFGWRKKRKNAAAAIAAA
jgi:hypothetical protein